MSGLSTVLSPTRIRSLRTYGSQRQDRQRPVLVEGKREDKIIAALHKSNRNMSGESEC